jgi:hypothetical protein
VNIAGALLDGLDEQEVDEADDGRIVRKGLGVRGDVNDGVVAAHPARFGFFLQ